MENRLKCMSWTQFDERRKKTKTVIIPSGACEVYGPHLPLGSDILVANRISELIAERVDAIVAPCLEIGQSHNLYGFPGTMYCHPEHLKAVYRDICESFIKWGFENLFVVNAHLGNSFPLNELLEDLESEYGVRCASVGWWQYVPKICQGVFETPNPHSHASEAGTSVLLYLFPEYVDMSKAPNSPSLFTDNYPNITKYALYERYSQTGTLGDATVGTAEKGKIIVERGLDEICSYIETVMKPR